MEVVNYGFQYWGSLKKIQINCLFLLNALFLIRCAKDCSSCDIVLPKNLYRTMIEYTKNTHEFNQQLTVKMVQACLETILRSRF